LQREGNLAAVVQATIALVVVTTTALAVGACTPNPAPYRFPIGWRGSAALVGGNG
jgi:hypothetical protein